MQLSLSGLGIYRLFPSLFFTAAAEQLYNFLPPLKITSPLCPATTLFTSNSDW